MINLFKVIQQRFSNWKFTWGCLSFGIKYMECVKCIKCCSSGVLSQVVYLPDQNISHLMVLFPSFRLKWHKMLQQQYFHLFGHQSNSSDWSQQQWIHSKVVSGNCSDCTKTCTYLDTVISSNGNIVITNCNQNKNCITALLAVIENIREPVTKVLLELPLDLPPN